MRENGDTLSIDNHDNDTNSCAEPEESSSEDSASDSSADPGVFVEKTEEELLEHYGLDALPEQIGGMAPVRDRSKGWYHTVEPLGLTVSEQDADQVISDYNTWFYMSWDPMRSAYLTLFTWQYDDTAPSYSYPDDDPDRNVEYVVFSVNGIGVSLETGFCSHEETEQIVAEITDYLKAHKTNG